MFRSTARFFYTNLRSFTKLEEMNKHLVLQRATHLVVYFRSSWNSQCEITDKHVNDLAGNNRFL